MAETSAVATIKTYPEDPLEMFKDLLKRVEDHFVTMNLATQDSKYTVLNRTVVYRGLVDNAITFVTERTSQKYQNIKANPKIGLTFLFQNVPVNNGLPETWQVRLIDAEAVELNEEQIAKLWPGEPLFAKIRSHICQCGAPIDHAKLQEQHDSLLQDYISGRNKLEQTSTYTAYKILPKCWDFYKSEKDKIADRVQYRKKEAEGACDANKWEIMHVAA